MRLWLLVFGLLAGLAAGLANPAAAGQALRLGERTRVTAVIDGDTVRIAPPVDGARQIRLVGIQAPKLPLGRKGFKQWPLADVAKAALEKLVLDREVRLSYGGQPMDRHGRLLAHLHDANDRWIQGEMLRRGMARVYSFADNRSLTKEMLAHEGAARAAGLGIWADPFYAIRKPQETAALIGSFQIVVGEIIDITRIRDTVYLNFDEDWRSDFTIRIGGGALKLFIGTRLEPAALLGKRVRVRGWLKSYNGPLIDTSHPEQIEVLGRE